MKMLRKKTERSIQRRPDLKNKPVVVFAAGCFNRVHAAHLRLLRHARTLGDKLVVILSNDFHNHKPNAVPAVLRKQRLEAYGIADEVLIGDAHGFAPMLRRVSPQILILGYDQKLPDAETEVAVAELGIETIVMPWYPGKEDPAAAHC